VLARFASDVRVITQPCQGLVEQVEAGELHTDKTRQLLRDWVQPLLAEGCDTLILGCTHYPFIKPLLLELLPAGVSLIDTGAAVARQLQRVLGEQQLLAPGPARSAQFYSSGDCQQLERVLPQLWGSAAAVSALD
jgi:glutamate racemase